MKSKNFTLRSEASELRGKREKPVSNETNWDRIVYLSLLAIVLVVLIYFGITSYLIVHGNGYVVKSKIILRTPDDIKITDLFVQPDDTVHTGELLYTSLEVNDQNVNTHLTEQEINIKSQIDEIKNDTYLIRQELTNLYKERSFYLTQKKETKQKIKLDVATLNDLNQIQEKLIDINGKIEILKAKLATLYSKGDSLRRIITPSEDGTGLQSGASLPPQNHASVQGVISNVYVRKGEIVFKEKPIMSIKPKNFRIFIIAKFERDDARYLMPGTVLTVEFNNGRESKAVIHDYLSVRLKSQTKDWIEAQKKEEIIVVKLYPFNDKAAKLWKSYRGIGVELSHYIF